MNYSDFFGKRNRIYKFAGGGPFEDDTYNKSYLDYLAKGMSNRDAAQLVWKDAQLSLSSDPTFNFNSDEGKQRYAQLEALQTQADTIENTSKLTFNPNGDAANNSTFGDKLKGFGQLRAGKTGLLLGQIGIAAMEGMDKALMGDKNFGVASNALDTAVHGVSKTLMSTGNPWAMTAGAALEIGNFATKASGATTAGYDVEMTNSAYSDSLAHQQSKSSRNWGGLTLGLTNIGMDKKMESQLRERNEAATMAILAASVAKEQSFEQEARMNTVQDVLLANLNALNGEMDTSLLIAKKGGKIARMMGYRAKLIEKAKYGRKLQSILVSEAGNILPTGALHAHLNHMDSDEITKKGIPVVQTGSDKEIKELLENGGDLIQAAEIERDEIIFSKELTDYIESKRENKEDRDVMLEVGKRLTKEILMNTKDESNLIKEVV